MTKKIFAQPEMMVVRMNNNDIVTLSLQSTNFNPETGTILAPGQRGLDDWDAGY
jgi:hypothetical protein